MKNIGISKYGWKKFIWHNEGVKRQRHATLFFSVFIDIIKQQAGIINYFDC